VYADYRWVPLEAFGPTAPVQWFCMPMSKYVANATVATVLENVGFDGIHFPGARVRKPGDEKQPEPSLSVHGDHFDNRCVQRPIELNPRLSDVRSDMLLTAQFEQHVCAHVPQPPQRTSLSHLAHGM